MAKFFLAVALCAALISTISAKPAPANDGSVPSQQVPNYQQQLQWPQLQFSSDPSYPQLQWPQLQFSSDPSYPQLQWPQFQQQAQYPQLTQTFPNQYYNLQVPQYYYTPNGQLVYQYQYQYPQQQQANVDVNHKSLLENAWETLHRMKVHAGDATGKVIDHAGNMATNTYTNGKGAINSGIDAGEKIVREVIPDNPVFGVYREGKKFIGGGIEEGERVVGSAMENGSDFIKSILPH